MKKVQVLLSSYNGEKYIKQQIDSILAQKGVNVNLLVRDDGSKDNTNNILEKYGDRIKVIYGENLGYTKSFLTLIDECGEADYYALSDQDDVWLEDKLISGVERLEKEEGNKPLLYCSALQRVNEDLEPGEIQNFPGLKTNIYSALVRERLAGCTFVFNNVLRDLLTGSSKLNLEYSHDSWTLLMCYACGGEVIYDDMPHILFRRYGTNTSVDGGGLKKRIHHEFRYLKSCRNQRINTVRALMDFKGDEVTETEILYKILRYKDSWRNTLSLALDKRLDCGITMANLINRYVVLKRCF